ncbi:condensation domain-containing protein [Streptomyces sp. NPDC003247]|uniref:condensation domain-containing protein n=1 Tax=Streptomyces sp. NPDC003247 TaxID=3364677 RepID=UPI0036B55502
MPVHGDLSIVFHGHRGGEAQLTWGQRFIWDIIMRLAPRDEHLNLDVVVPVPEGVDVEGVREALARLIETHESLRTRYAVASDGSPRQILVQSGTLPVELREAAGEPDPSSAAPAGPLVRALTGRRFDLTREPPVRIGVVTREGAPAHVVMAMSHMVADGRGLHVIERDLTALLSGGAGSDGVALSPGRQPLDQAAFELGDEAAARIRTRAVDHWRRSLRRFPPSMFLGTATASARPRFWHGHLTAPALPVAASIVAAAQRATVPSVILTAFCSMLSHRLGSPHLSFVIRTANRFQPGTADAVGHLSQKAPFTIDLSGADFPERVARVHRSAVTAYWNGCYPPQELGDLLADEASRGRHLQLDTTLNVVPGDFAAVPGPSGQPAAYLAELENSSRYRVLDRREDEDVALFVNIEPPDGMSLLADTRYFAPAEIEAALRAIQRIVVKAALGEADPWTGVDEIGLPVRSACEEPERTEAVT